MPKMMNKKIVVSVLVSIFLMVCLVNPAIAQASTDAVLILHFDEGSGTTVKDETGHGNDGIIHGVTWVDGISGKALSFDGMDDYVDCGGDSSLNIVDEITIEAWVKPHSLSNNYMCIAGKDKSGGARYDSYSLKIMNNNNFAFNLIIDGRGERLETSLSDEIWSHFVGTYDGLNMILYKNGLEVNHISVSGLITTQPNTNFVIGAYSNHDLFFNGIIDEVAIYSRALTPEEINTHYLAKSAGESTKESASALIDSVSNCLDSLKLNDASTSAIEESLKKAQSAYDIGNYDEAYELAMSAQKMADDTYETQQHIESAQSEIDEDKSASPEIKDVEIKTKEAKDIGKSVVIFIIVIFFAVGCISYLMVKKRPSDKSVKKENKEKEREREVHEEFEEHDQTEEFEEVVEIDIPKANDKKQQGMAIINKFDIADLTDEHCEKAEYEFRETLKFNPDDLEARLYLALCLGHKNKIVEIIRLVEEIVRLEPNNTAHAILGRIYDHQKRYEDAANEYKKALTIFGSDPEKKKSQEASTDTFAQIMLGIPHGDEKWENIHVRLAELQKLLKKPRGYCTNCGKKLDFIFNYWVKVNAKIYICENCAKHINTGFFLKKCPICRSNLSFNGMNCNICGATFKVIASTSMFTDDIWKLTDGDSPYLNKGFTIIDWIEILAGKSSGPIVCPGCNCGITKNPNEGEFLECKYCGRKLEVKGKQLKEVQDHEITSTAVHKVIVHSKNIIWPPFCSICLGPAEEFKTRTDSSSLELIFYYSSKTFTLPDVPYCHHCYKKIKKIFSTESEGIRISKSSKPDDGIIELYFRNPEYAKMFRELNES